MENNRIKISKKALNKSYWRWMFGNLSSMSFEWLEAFGYADSMSPVLKELYGDDQAELIQGLKRHSIFYNTEPQVGAIINGIGCGLEEERANGAEIDDEIIQSVKIGLMGPIAGIGDAMVPGMLIPLLLSIGMSLADGGSLLGPVFYVVTYIPIMLFISHRFFMKGYELGGSAIEMIVGSMAARLREAFNLLGAIVIGGVAASYVALNLNIQIPTGVEGDFINVNEIMNGIFPGILPLLLVVFSWWMLSKKKISPLKAMGVLVVIAVIGVVVGVL